MPSLLRNDPQGFQSALLSHLPPRSRARLIAYQERKQKILDTMCVTLKALGLPDGCIHKTSN
jgi:hypothetical protein